MFGCLRSCLGTALVLALLAGGGAALWYWGPELPLGGARSAGRPAVPSPELAEATLDRFEAFQNGEHGSELRLGDAELSSLVRYALPGLIPPGVEDPTVRLRDGHLHLGARLSRSTLPDLRALRELSGLLPDTVRVEIRGTLTPFEADRAALHVDRVEAARIPLPSRVIPEILEALGRTDAAGLPPSAVAIPLPHGLRAAYVLRDSLVLVANR